MQNNFDKKYQEYLDYFNAQLDIALKSFSGVPEVLNEAMCYAVQGGGKRVRPVLCIATADMLGIDWSCVKEFAVAIEFIHSYSLVHDDLPAMDNDDYRRGKLSTHKKFGEAYGILAGDALLNHAFEYCLNKSNFSLLDAKALKILAEYSGSSGMIAGQVLDLQNEKNGQGNEKTLYEIYINKTAKLLTAPILIASRLANDKYYEQLKSFGENLGVMFQITDDIMDEEGTVDSIGKTPNKDQAVDKLTSIKIFGKQGALDRKKYHFDKCISLLNGIENSDFLRDFTVKMYERKS